jgi:hypothetical protein
MNLVHVFVVSKLLLFQSKYVQFELKVLKPTLKKYLLSVIYNQTYSMTG